MSAASGNLMSTATARRLAAGLGAVFLALSVTGLVLIHLGAGEVPYSAAGEAPFLLTNLAFIAVGALIVSKFPRHPVGWLLMVPPALGEGLWNASVGYAAFALAEDLPGARIAAWLSGWVSTFGAGTFGLAILLFPTGRLLSPRWRPLGWLLVGAPILNAVLIALQPGPLGDVPAVSNPVGVGALGGVTAWPLVMALDAAAVVSLFVRYRRAGGRERQQIKWVLASAALLIALFIVGGLAFSGPAPSGTAQVVSGLVIALLLTAMPASIGIAILRHRLYDIDVVINRALVYGALTATLIGGYLLGVLGFGAALRPLTGDSDLAIAASTLLVAALFRPARTRIKHAVDRRFYRRKYDAERTLHDFAGRLREHQALESLTTDLRGVVARTVEPAGVSVWLKGQGQ
ncbi:MAG: hypothetical protein ACR2NA_12330 [Solirubrobacterales bacterium]